MKRIVLPLLLVCAFLPAVRAEGPALLVCDLQRVTEECDEAIEMVASLRKRSDDTRNQFQAEVAALQGRQRDLLNKKLSERDPKWYEDYAKAVQDENELKAKAALFNARVNDEIARKIAELMKGVRQESQKIMKERGALMVIVSKTGPMKFEDDQQLKDEYVSRRVLCAVEGADITEEVLHRMNTWWKEHRSSDGTAPKREEGAAESGKPADKVAKPAK